MEKRNEKILWTGIAALLVLGTVSLATTDPNTDRRPQTGDNSSPDQDKETELLPKTTNKTTIYFFWGDGCPYCAEEKPFLEKLDEEHEDLEVKMYEVYNSRENQKIYKEVASKYGIQAGPVPATFLGDEHWRGYKEEIGKQIEQKAEECLEKGCEEPF